jgi:hypothetical protein
VVTLAHATHQEGACLAGCHIRLDGGVRGLLHATRHDRPHVAAVQVLALCHLDGPLGRGPAPDAHAAAVDVVGCPLPPVQPAWQKCRVGGVQGAGQGRVGGCAAAGHCGRGSPWHWESAEPAGGQQLAAHVPSFQMYTPNPSILPSTN